MLAENVDLFSIEDVIKSYKKFVLKMHNMMIKMWLLCKVLAKQLAHDIEAMTSIEGLIHPEIVLQNPDSFILQTFSIGQ
jgi:hypothetical protein